MNVINQMMNMRLLQSDEWDVISLLNVDMNVVLEIIGVPDQPIFADIKDITKYSSWHVR